MKKLSLLIALCILISIGGVYAVWTYAGTTIAPKTGMALVKGMGEVKLEGAAGAYSEVTNNIKLTVEPKTGTFNTQLVFSGELKIKFTPSPTISNASLANALNATITIHGVDLASAVYDDGTGEQQIYTLSANPTITLTEDSWTEESDGSYTYTLQASTLADIITMAEFNLPSHDEYLAFQTAHQHAVFRADIAPAPATSGT